MDKTEPERGHKGGHNSLSSININKETTTNIEKSDNLNQVFIPDKLKEIGFKQNHMAQIQTKFPQAVNNLQRSLEALAFDIEEQGFGNFCNSKRIKNIIAWFFGAAKGGEYESSSPNFLTEEKKGEKAITELLRKRNENRKKSQKEKKDLAFEEWRETTSDEKIKKLVPPGVLEPFNMFHIAQVKDYFVKNEMDNFLSGLQ